MTAFTEAPLSINRRVGDYQLTGRASTPEEFRTAKALIDQMAAEILGSAPTQHASTTTLSVVPQADPVAQAVENLNAAGIQATPVATGGIEERTDRFGNRYQRGNPDVPSCQHGPRVVAYKTSKAGKPYKAFACVNDTPFGNYQNGKCAIEYPER